LSFLMIFGMKKEKTRGLQRENLEGKQLTPLTAGPHFLEGTDEKVKMKVQQGYLIPSCKIIPEPYLRESHAKFMAVKGNRPGVDRAP